MELVTGPSPWQVLLTDGSELTIWATAFSREDDVYEFDELIDASPDEQAWLDITGRTPSNPKRVIVVVARIPAGIVAKVWTGHYPLQPGTSQ